MKAILMQQAGAADLLHYTEVTTPEIKEPHDLLIKIKAAGVNPIDTKLRGGGTYYPDKMPAILGCDGSGEVVAVGHKVENFKPYFYVDIPDYWKRSKVKLFVN